jgi:hypothetical protein
MFDKKKYNAAWRETHRNEVKAYAAAYRKANPDMFKASSVAYYKANSDRLKANAITWSKANPEKAKEYNITWYKANSNKLKADAITWRKTNPDKRTGYAAKQNAAKKQRVPAWADHDKINEWYELAAFATEVFETPIEVDHIVPLNGKLVSGLHVDYNMQLLTSEANNKKHNKFIV